MTEEIESDFFAYQKRYIKEDIATRAYGTLLMELDGNDFIITEIGKGCEGKSTNTIHLKGWEAKRLSVFIDKHYVPSRGNYSESSSRLSRTFPEHYPHHGNYPPGKPPERGD